MCLCMTAGVWKLSSVQQDLHDSRNLLYTAVNLNCSASEVLVGQKVKTGNEREHEEIGSINL